MITNAYLAGIIDGEGSIGTTKTGTPRHIVIRVVIANTNVHLLDRLQIDFGGTFSVRERGHQPGWKPFASLAWTGRGAESILKRVLPYLIVKRAQALIALELMEGRNRPRSERLAYRHVPAPGMPSRIVGELRPEIAAKEEAYAVELRRLNKKGA